MTIRVLYTGAWTLNTLPLFLSPMPTKLKPKPARRSGPGPGRPSTGSRRSSGGMSTAVTKGRRRGGYIQRKLSAVFLPHAPLNEGASPPSALTRPFA